MARLIETVSNQFGDVIPGATVRVLSTGGTLLQTLTTDADGMFYLTAPAGEYNLEISGPGITTKNINGVILADPVAGVPGSATGDVGKVLTATSTANAPAWSALPEELPANAVGDAGKILAAGATANSREWVDAYTHPTGDGNLHVPATGTTNAGKVLTAGATAGSFSWTELTQFVEKAGDTMTGALTLPAQTGGGSVAPTGLQAISLNYADATYQPLDALLTSISGLTTAADQVIYTTAANAASVVDVIDTPDATPSNDAGKMIRLGTGGKIDDGFINFQTTTYKGNINLTVAYAAPNPAWNVGDFGVVAASGNVDPSWNAHLADPDPVLVSAGDLAIWDGSVFHIISSTSDLTDYVHKAGDTMTGPLVMPRYTVATLPTGVIGARAFVTDATGRTLSGKLTGGGTEMLPVFYNGTEWVWG